MAPSLFSALPPRVSTRRYTSIYFGKNQLSRGLISLSLLTTGHPSISQDTPVRSSTSFYRSFNLPMVRSPPFRVYPMQLFALFRLAFAAPPPRKGLSLLHRISPRPIMQEVRRHPTKGLRPLVCNKFQVLFHSPNRGTFHLSLTVLVHYRSTPSI